MIGPDINESRPVVKRKSSEKDLTSPCIPAFHMDRQYARLFAPGAERMPAGRGTGHWQTVDVTDGLKNNAVKAIVQE